MPPCSIDLVVSRGATGPKTARVAVTVGLIMALAICTPIAICTTSVATVSAARAAWLIALLAAGVVVVVVAGLTPGTRRVAIALGFVVAVVL